MSFPSYPQYKDSGVEWLGDEPEHWELRRLKFLCDIQTIHWIAHRHFGITSLETLANGGNPAMLGVLYAINREATAEQERIQNDDTLSETQREIELKKLELEQLKATAKALGESLGVAVLAAR